jgi:hypothetical protein
MFMPDDLQQRRRRLRLRIARLRRRIDRRLHAACRRGRKLLSWRSYVRRYPGYAALAALGAGLTLGAGLKSRRLLDWLGARLLRRGVAAADDIRQLLALRWQLARLEFRLSARTLRRLVVAMAAAGVMALVSLPLWLVWLAESLDGRLGIGRGGWLGIFALTLTAVASVVALLAWRGFRRRFAGLAETLEECREDLVWLREWLGKTEK